MNTNLNEFWTVQRQSGEHSHIFLSDEEATNAYHNWRNEAFAEFEKWKEGKSTSIGVFSKIEADLEGGCYQSYSIADYCLPGEIYYHPIGSTNSNKWEECKGFNRIRWGNLALERPNKRKK